MTDLIDPWIARLRKALIDTEDTFIGTTALLEALGEPAHTGTNRRLRRCMDAVGWMPAKDDDGVRGYKPGRYVDEKMGQADNAQYELREFGVIVWKGRFEEGLPCAPGWYDPFEEKLRFFENNPSVRLAEGLRDSAVELRDDLELARTVALSIFGSEWSEHLLAVYDRLKLEQRRRVVRRERELRKMVGEHDRG